MRVCVCVCERKGEEIAAYMCKSVCLFNTLVAGEAGSNQLHPVKKPLEWEGRVKRKTKVTGI